MAGLYKEAWLHEFVGENNEHLRNNSIFTQHAVDWSPYLDSAVINIPIKGNKTNAVSVNPTYPLTVTNRTDTTAQILLKNYATDPDRVGRGQIAGIAVDPTNTLLKDQRDNLMGKVVTDGIHSAAPIQDTAFTPVFSVPAANTLAPSGYRYITVDDIRRLRVALDAKYKGRLQWVLEVSAEDFYNLQATNSTLLAQQGYLNKAGEILNLDVMRIAGFEVIVEDRTPVYTNGGVKQPVGTLAVPGTNRIAAVAYVKNLSFGFTPGRIDFYERMNDPEWHADVFSMAMYAYAGAPATVAADFRYFGAILKTN